MKDLLIVVYNDKYGNGDTQIEGITDDFPKWLEQHNQQRKADGNHPESADEFDTFMYTPLIFNQ